METVGEVARVVEADGYVDFWSAGTAVKGEFHCSDCGYGVIVMRELPQCPMCGSRSWEQSTWSPFSGGRRFAD